MGDNRKRLSRRERQALQNPNATFIAATQYQFHQASLVPMAEELAALDRIQPGLAERAFSMAERQQIHRHGLEDMAVREGVKRASRGQHYSFIIAMAAIAGGIYLSATGHTTKGVVAIVGALVALTSNFLYARSKNKEELDKKDPRRANK